MSDEGTVADGRSREKNGPLWSPSIKDIARLANVSHSTVSRALQNSPLVKPHTAEKIRKIASESGYRASALARGLVTRKTRTIGLVVTTIADPFTAEVVSGIYQAASERGYSVFLADSGADPEREKRVVQSFAEQRVDGIVVTSSRVGALYLPLLSEMRVPIVLVNDQHPGAFVHSVLIKNFEGARAAANHLIGLGHRRIAYIGDQFGYQSDTERFGGYCDALKTAGVPLHEELVARGDGKPERAMLAMEKLLSHRPTAVCCYNDRTALGAMRSIRMHGLRVPQDISVTGFDDIFLACYTDPPLTTIRQPMRKMGVLAMEGLFQLMSGVESEIRIEVDPELVVRESTARVPLRDFAERYTEAWNSGDPAQVASFFAPGGWLRINDGASAVGRAAVQEVVQGFMTAFPDLRLVMDDLRPLEYHWTFTGTNTGPGGTGQKVRFSGFEAWTIGEDGRIAESIGTFDQEDYQRQLGS